MEADLGIFPGIDITVEIMADYSTFNTDTLQPLYPLFNGPSGNHLGNNNPD